MTAVWWRQCGGAGCVGMARGHELTVAGAAR